MRKILWLLLALMLGSCASRLKTSPPSFTWQGANLYFLITDRFKNGTPANDVNFNRTEKAATLRGFEGGDLRGVIQKLDENYFTDLGINAIWLTPLVEQIHGAVNEGNGITYGFHGYWTKDWTALDPNFGTRADLKELVEKAHKKNIRVVLDAVINHTGPVTPEDPVFPESWVRTAPVCTYTSYETTTACTLVKNLPDILTENTAAVDLPPMLMAKWKKEGRYEREMKSLDDFFRKTAYPRAPKYYIMKWLSDYVSEFGIDGYRVDTVKHTGEEVWKEFQQVCEAAFSVYKTANPGAIKKSEAFFMVGEVYGYGLSQKQEYNFGDKKVNYFQNGFQALINFDFKTDAKLPYEALFSKYTAVLHSDLKDKTVLNYLTSHDDGAPFDLNRTRTYEAATKLLLSPGISQIYYGDESARSLIIPGASGDANLRSGINWDQIKNDDLTGKLLEHYQKLGKFRAAHPAIGAGIHSAISLEPYWFSRTYGSDQVLIGLDLPVGEKELPLQYIFKEGTVVRDAYSGITVKIKSKKTVLNTKFGIILLEKIN